MYQILPFLVLEVGVVVVLVEVSTSPSCTTPTTTSPMPSSSPPRSYFSGLLRNISVPPMVVEVPYIVVL